MELHKRYLKGKRIYSGPYSDIYEGKDEVTLEVIALKVVDIDISIKPHSIKQEIAILKKLDHKGVLPFIDQFKYLDDVYLVTPLYKFNLQQLLEINYTRKTTKFNFDDLTKNTIVTVSSISNSAIESLLVPLVDSLCYLHSQGIIHRDLKPSNIYFVDSDISEPVIGDFGISYDTGNGSQLTGESPSTKFTDVCSGIYKPPELCFGVTDYGFEIDIWCLGIIFTVIYSTNFSSILEKYEVFNDIALINALFSCFGTPYVAPAVDDDPLYWPQMDDGEKYHFKAFEFAPHARKPIEELLPRCENPLIAKIFNRMMTYQGDRRLTSRQLKEDLLKVIK